MSDTINTNQNQEQQPTTPTPEANGGQGEKLFTQADLDRIIGERLARERAKAEPSSEDAREADLKAREARLSCREYIAGEGYPADLLELFDTTDADKFKEAVEKLDGMVETQELMKAVNAYYRKEKTLDGCPDLTQEEIEMLKAEMASSYHWADVPYLPYLLSNNNANIKRTRDRLEGLKKVKEAGSQETECEFCKVVENTEIMRLQLIFDGKPEPEVRDILKSNGFKWAPSQSAWQRQLTNNARYALKRVMEELEKLEAAE